MKRTTKLIASYWEFVKLQWHSPELEVKSFAPVTEHLAEICYVPRDEMAGIHKNVQPIVYAFITAMARIGMMEDMRRLQEMGGSLFYTDTGEAWTARQTGSSQTLSLPRFHHL